MAPVSRIVSCIRSLEENPRDVYLEVTSVLLKLANNVIENPANPKYRSVRLANPIIAKTLVPAIGAMECLFEMGFEETDDSVVLTLSTNTNLQYIKEGRDEILRRRKIIQDGAQTSSSKSCSVSSLPQLPAASSSPTTPKGEKTVVKPVIISNDRSMLETIKKYSTYPDQYEDKNLQKEALACVPLQRLEIAAEQRLRAAQRAIKKSGNIEELQEPSAQQMLLLELLSWFKNSFFTWVDTLPCFYCSGETKSARREKSNEFSIDVFKCINCQKETLFPRYNDARKLLQTRRGRCGEWANCFTLLCRSLGWEARLVLDVTDHVWTEVFLPNYDRWVHCDPCENAFDQPLMYELGWKKQLSYIVAFSNDDIQDVSWRYSASHSEMLKRRKMCSETEFLNIILEIRRNRQQNLPAARKAYVVKRTLKEIVELMKEPVAEGSDYAGRQSGSLAWRLARGEIVEETNFAPHVWKPNKMELDEKFVHIQYCTSSDCYRRPAGGDEILQGWQSGAFLVDSMFRKEEKDWKQVYLTRKEGSDKGKIEWKIDLQQTGLVVDTVTIALSKFTCENGSVLAVLCGENTCLLVGGSEFTTNDLSGEESLTLKVEVSGGRGDTAWQHAQILRSGSNSDVVTLDMKVKLRQR